MCPEFYIDDLPFNTRRLVEECSSYIEETMGLEVTFLINCLLGLVVIVSEKHKDKIGSKKLSIFSSCLPDKFIGTRYNYSRIDTIEKKDYCHISASYFISKLRNGISHQNIDGNKNVVNGNWESVTIKDFYVEDDEQHGIRKGDNNFQITIDIDQLKKLAIEISKLVPEKTRSN